MKIYKLDEKACNILLSTVEGHTQIQIAKELSMTESAVSQRINTLQRYEYLIKEKSGIINTFGLTPLGLAVVQEMARRGINALTEHSKNYDPLIRIHNLETKYDILTSLSPSEPLQISSTSKIEYRLINLKNQSSVLFVYNKHTAMLTPSSLIIYGQEVVGNYTELHRLWLKAMEDIDNIALSLEAKLNIKLKRLDKDTLIKYVIKLHVALVDNPIAKLLNDVKGETNESTSENKQ